MHVTVTVRKMRSISAEESVDGERTPIKTPLGISCLEAALQRVFPGLCPALGLPQIDCPWLGQLGAGL